MLNTNAAVRAAQRPFAIADAPNSITVGAATGIDGRTSFASNARTITSHQWSAIGVTGATPSFGNASAAMTTVQVADASIFTLRLTVTDDQGAQDTADVAMATPTPPPPPPPTTPPAAAPSGGGGGGSLGWLFLGMLWTLARRRSLQTH
jgi:serine protease